MKKTFKDNIDHFFDYDMYVPTRTIYMGSAEYSISEGESGTDGKMAERLIKALHILDLDAPEGNKPITIIMNNPGGNEPDGMAIYDAIQACKNFVIIQVFGQASSMGSIILQAADERVLAPNAEIMIHYGHITVDDHAKSVAKLVENSKKRDKWMEDLYLEKIRVKHPDYQMAKVKHMCNFDHFLDAREAVNLGLADRILGEEQTEE